jgi:hypothetical protein
MSVPEQNGDHQYCMSEPNHQDCQIDNRFSCTIVAHQLTPQHTQDNFYRFHPDPAGCCNASTTTGDWNISNPMTPQPKPSRGRMWSCKCRDFFFHMENLFCIGSNKHHAVGSRRQENLLGVYNQKFSLNRTPAFRQSNPDHTNFRGK